jgi:hypothetical protein
MWRKLLAVFIVMTTCLPVATADPVAPPARHDSGNWRLPPGIYKLQPMHAIFCLTYTQGDVVRAPHLVQRLCKGRDDLDQQFHLVPNPNYVDLYSIHSPLDVSQGNQIPARPGDSCARVAGGVVFGPPSIDSRVCDGADETFFRPELVASDPANGDVYAIRTHSDDCWDVQDKSIRPDAQAIQYGCQGSSNQHFRFVYMGPLTNGNEQSLAALAGWNPTAEPRHMNLPSVSPTTKDSQSCPVLQQAFEWPGFDLPGSDIRSIQMPSSISDTAGECRFQCASQCDCKAYSLVRPGVQGPNAVCWLKYAIPERVFNPAVRSGRLR